MITCKEFFKTRLLLEANPEKRIAFLVDKYGQKIKDLFEKRFGNKTWDAHGMIDNIVTNVDPENGTYSEWIVRHLFDLNDRDLSMFNEDSYKITEDLEKYHKYKKYFKIAGKDNNNPNTNKLGDINQIKGFDDLYESLRVIEHYIKKDEEAAISKELENEVEKIYKSENYLILVPKTQEASCAYGRGTRWCTASTGSYNYFDRYTRDGPLYIIIDKKENEKYQFHFQSGQYMNSDDSGVNVREFLNNHEEIKNTLFELALLNKNENFVMNNGGVYFILDKLDNMPPDDVKKMIQNNSLLAFQYGMKKPEFVNESQSLFKFEHDNTITLCSGKDEWSDFLPFFEKSSHRTVESVLEGDATWIHDSFDNSYDEEYWTWLDEQSQTLLQEYILNKFNHRVDSIDEAKQFIEEDPDEEEYFHDLLTRSYDDAYSSALEGEYHNIVTDELLDIVAVNKQFKYTGDDNQICFTGYTFKTVQDIFDDMVDSVSEVDVFEYPASKGVEFFNDWASSLNKLANPDFDRIYASPNIKNDGEIFNSRFQSDIEIPDKPKNPQMELDLSGINRGMTKFDAYIKRLFEEDLGHMGPTTQVTKSATPPTGTQSKVANGVKKPISSSIGAKPMNPSAVASNGQNAIDYGSIFSSKDPNTMKLFMSDPNNIEGFKQHLADPKNREAFKSSIKDPNQWGSIIDMISTPSPQ